MIVTDRNFKEEVLESDIPVVVDFWASWCLPCKMMESMLDKLSKEYEGRVKFCKINVDQNRGTASEYSIGGVPTFMLFKDGALADRLVGAQTEKKLRDIIDS